MINLTFKNALNQIRAVPYRIPQRVGAGIMPVPITAESHILNWTRHFCVCASIGISFAAVKKQVADCRPGYWDIMFVKKSQKIRNVLPCTYSIESSLLFRPSSESPRQFKIRRNSNRSLAIIFKRSNFYKVEFLW